VIPEEEVTENSERFQPTLFSQKRRDAISPRDSPFAKRNSCLLTCTPERHIPVPVPSSLQASSSTGRPNEEPARLKKTFGEVGNEVLHGTVQISEVGSKWEMRIWELMEVAREVEVRMTVV